MRKNTIKHLLSVNPWLTLAFNLYYFPLKQALKLPILVSYRTKVAEMRGSIVLKDTKPTFGLLKIGFQSIGLQDGFYDRTVWQVSGNVVLRGNATIGRGCKICVDRGGTLQIGSQFNINGSSKVICVKSVSFGHNVLMSWGCTIMDTDFHSIRDAEGQRLNSDQAIIVGNDVWIGMNVTILKGCIIPNGCVISAGSTLSKMLTKEHCVYGSHGMILKENITW